MGFDQSVYMLYSDECFTKLDGITRVELSYLDENDKKRTIIFSKDTIFIPKVNNNDPNWSDSLNGFTNNMRDPGR